VYANLNHHLSSGHGPAQGPPVRYVHLREQLAAQVRALKDKMFEKPQTRQTAPRLRQP